MRIATLIISLFLMLILGIQSLAVAAGGSITSSLSDSSAEQKAGEDLAAGGSIGILVALLWLVAAALVLSKPKASSWIFGVAGVFCLLGGSSGFSDLYLWAFVSGAFALMSWRGISEKKSKDERERVAYLADVQAMVQAQQLSTPPA
jgi:hypothetical protein